MAIGRISGPLLKANLVRDGIDLAFEDDLLYLDVDPGRIGINTNSPQYDLDVNGTTRSDGVRVTNQLDVGTFTITDNDIRSSSGTISFLPATGEAVVYHSRLVVDDLQIDNNTITTSVSNSPIEIRPNGTGTIELQGNTNITGNLNVTGNIEATGSITIGGNITIGDMSTDTITINAAIRSSLIPETDNLYDLGSPSYRWNDTYVNNFYTTTLNVPELQVGNINIQGTSITTTANQNITIGNQDLGGVNLGNFRIVQNVITNISVNAITQLVSTGPYGYFKIAGTNGFVPPKGTEANRPDPDDYPGAVLPTGMTRYNTVSRALELWDGTTWASPAGSSGAVSENDANEISAIYALILG